MLYNLNLTEVCDTKIQTQYEDEALLNCLTESENYCLSKDNIENFKSGAGKDKKLRFTHSLCAKLGEVFCKSNEYQFNKIDFKKFLINFKTN